VAHTWRTFDAADSIQELVLVVRSGMEADFHDLAKKYQFEKPYRLVPGGKERQDSVWNGLEALSSESDLVAIQDGARPCTSQNLIAITLAAAAVTGAAVAAQAVTDTVKQSADGRYVDRTLDRSKLWAVQTPQVFQVEVIRRALGFVRDKDLAVTDDTAACEMIGQRVELVVSAEANPKVTRPEDLPYIEWLLDRMSRQPKRLAP
ncbi:MAG TPA: 2-C-methyl-D-erythritol 4-phosphate cytidylyltransferase, partial [Clostridia bacterium]|nr:2-C-methyl-D-erythritol 4-phosphate cytidylyltransferase [Clostridia bacterium]